MSRTYLVAIRQIMDDVPLKVCRRKTQAIRLAQRFDRDVATLAGETVSSRLKWNEPSLPISVGVVEFDAEGHPIHWLKVKDLCNVKEALPDGG